MKSNFFGSKLNTVLLLVLVILMFFAIRIMKQDKGMNINIWQKPSGQIENNDDWKKYPLNTTVGYHPCGTDPNANDCLSEELLEKVLGNKDDLVAFSIIPEQEVSGQMTVQGIIKGGYFFEGNLPVSILDSNKNVTKYGPGHGQATTDWMTGGPVSFYIDFDFGTIPKGKAFIQLTQDDPSGGESGRPIRYIIIPIIIK